MYFSVDLAVYFRGIKEQLYLKQLNAENHLVSIFFIVLFRICKLQVLTSLPAAYSLHPLPPTLGLITGSVQI